MGGAYNAQGWQEECLQVFGKKARRLETTRKP
jgi:hypothetical protein